MRLTASLRVLAGLAVACVSGAPSAADAPPDGKVARVATLWTTTRTVAQPYIDEIEHSLRERGWHAGRNLVFEHRFTDGKPDALPALAAEVVALRPDVAVAPLAPAALALKRLSGTLPIVFILPLDPVGAGLAASLGHPGGNATGTTGVQSFEVAGKRLQMLREFAPGARRVAVVGNAAYAGYQQVRQVLDAAAPGLGFTLVDATATDLAGFGTALASIPAQRVDALFVAGDNLTQLHLKDVVALASRLRLPAVYSQKEFCAGGGLACYGVDMQANYRRSAAYVDRILRGASPAELPIEMPTRFVFAINLGTARALGIGVPQSLKLQADVLIE